MADDPDDPVLHDVTFHDAIEAYCDRSSYRPGDTVGLHVSTRAEAYDVVVERWGSERDVVWRSERPLTGRFHDVPDDADARGCGWPTAVEIPVGTEWRSGFHLVTLHAHDVPRDQATSHACFVVRPSAPTAATVLVLGTNTWNAYNNWGGRSLYTGGTKVSFRRPFARGMLCRPEVERDDRKARPVRWDEEPDADGEIFQRYRTEHHYPAAIGSSGWFTHERRFVEWAEAGGWQFDVAVSADLDDDPTALDGYDLVVSVGHDEYWSAPQRAALERHVEGGGNVAVFSGNTMFWQVRLEDDGDTMIGFKYAAHRDDPALDTDPSSITGMWADPIVGRPEAALLGAASAWGLYHRFGMATARGVGGFIVARDDHWMLANTGLRYGDVLGARDGVVGYETMGCRLQLDDRQLPVSRGDATPAIHEIVATCPSSNLRVGEYPSSISALSDQGDLEFIAERLFGTLDEDSIARVRHGNAAMVTSRPFGADAGEVVTIGTTDWVFGLTTDAAVATVTRNVLGHLGADTREMHRSR